MLTRMLKKFCAGVVSGKSAVEAYRAAYPRRKADTAAGAAAGLLADPEIAAEVARLRGAQETNTARTTETTETTESATAAAVGAAAVGAAAEVGAASVPDGAAESLVEKVVASGALTRAEKRAFLARVVRANLQDGSVDGDLLQSVDITRRGEDKVLEKQRLADKLKAIQLDNDLAGEGAEAEAHDALSALLERIRR